MMINFAAFCMLSAGILHIIATPERWKAHLALGMLFIVLGIAQIVYAYVLIRTPVRKIFLFGIALNTGLLLGWLLTQVLPHLANSSREPLTLLAGARKLLELISVELLLTQYRHRVR